jgi:hypothetical protein
MVRTEPLNCSVRVLSFPTLPWLWPTAHASVGDSTWTPNSRLPSLPRVGTLATVQLVPFQSRRSGTFRFFESTRAAKPDAQTSSGPSALTPVRWLRPLVVMFGTGTIDHLVPFQ